MHSLVLAIVGRHEEGMAEAQRAASIDPGSFVAHWQVLRGYCLAGLHAQAVECAAPLLAKFGRHPWMLGDLAMAYAGLGNRDLARAVYDELEARSRLEFISPFWLSVAAAAAGLMNEAMEQARRAVDSRDPLAVMGPRLQEWEPLRGQGGYGQLLAKLGSAQPGEA
jgi:tetratricopeptide (TPR) repeat protein